MNMNRSVREGEGDESSNFRQTRDKPQWGQSPEASSTQQASLLIMPRCILSPRHPWQQHSCRVTHSTALTDCPNLLSTTTYTLTPTQYKNTCTTHMHYCYGFNINTFPRAQVQLLLQGFFLLLLFNTENKSNVNRWKIHSFCNGTFIYHHSH